jgi:archaeosortase A (PGF-CTERM-specific)
VSSFLAPLDALAAYSDPLGWVVIAAFLTGTGLVAAGRRETARYVAAGAWAIFAVFWLSVFPHFMFEVKSVIEGVGSLAAIPASLYTAYLLLKGRESLLTLSTAVGVMGVLYFPTQAIPWIRKLLIETVADQTYWGITTLGYAPEYTTGPIYGYQNEFEFAGFSTYIIYACTGIGSIAIFGGLIAATEAPLPRKLRSFALATGIIWVLNIVRNVFVAIAAGRQWFQHDIVASVAGTAAGVEGPHVSFWVAHSVISQTLSVVALVGITWIVVHRLPEMLSILEEALFVLTGTEYDLREEFDINPAVADGGSRSEATGVSSDGESDGGAPVDRDT